MITSKALLDLAIWGAAISHEQIPVVTLLSEVLHAIAQHDPALVFLCNPNNPTGHLWSTADVDRIAAAAPLVLDEAYAGFLRPPPPPAEGPGRLVLRSLTKDHALAGLRIGYAVGEPALLSVLEKLLAPWGVSTAAQAKPEKPPPITTTSTSTSGMAVVRCP